MKTILTYTGRRLTAQGVYQVFLDGKEERWYRGIARIVIGARYEATKKGKHVQLSKRPRPVDYDHHSNTDVAKWEALDLLVQREAELNSAYRRAKASLPLKRIADQLRPLIAGLGYNSQRKAIEALAEMACDRIEPIPLDEAGFAKLAEKLNKAIGKTK